MRVIINKLYYVSKKAKKCLSIKNLHNLQEFNIMQKLISVCEYFKLRKCFNEIRYIKQLEINDIRFKYFVLIFNIIIHDKELH